MTGHLLKQLHDCTLLTFALAGAAVAEPALAVVVVQESIGGVRKTAVPDMIQQVLKALDKKERSM